MASNTVEICNIALGYLGGNLITSIDDDSKEAALCKANFTATLDAILETRDWAFATCRFETATPVSPAPTFGYANAFQIDSSVLRVVEVNDNAYEWQVEGRTIVTDQGSVQYKAVCSVPDPIILSPAFVQAFATRLAAEIAIPLTNSRTMQGNMFELYGVKLREAQASDGRQGTTRRIRGPRFRR